MHCRHFRVLFHPENIGFAEANSIQPNRQSQLELYSMQPTQYLNISLAGLATFGIFFYTFANGMGNLIIAAGCIGLLLNTIIAGFFALDSFRRGILSALAYSAPLAVFSALAVGDLVLKGRSGPFIFWFSAAAITFTAGLCGALLIFVYRLFVPKN
ncbi:hypothetical protein Q8A57_09310 [Porticoccus litoralis]|uniref:Uncharacterized protein n=1 Tax=Porticoccus litoralis TaxID=434086 RepID=A0AAW8B7Q0_9GAMM|nr:hypothetical protein [Porticoccus litoralis]MDP1521164.1 hypothetical protein [Porticoccus litoralis]